jgi:hypothetical protein
MKKAILAGGMFAVIVLGTLAVAVAGAQDNSPTATPAPSATDTDTDTDAETEDQDTYREFYLNDLATRLGVTVDELKADIQESQKALVDKALADGKITQEEADNAKERIDAGEHVPFHFIFGDGPRHRFVKFAYNLVEETADVLGIDESEVATSVRSGSSLEEIASANGMSADAFKTALLAEAKANLDAKVADGDLEQERADEIYAKLSENIDTIVTDTNTDPGPPFGPHRGHGGPGRWFNGPNDEIESDSSIEPSAITTTF